MSDLLSELNSHILPGWKVTAIIYDFNHETWEVTAWSNDLVHAVMRQDNSIEEALFHACYDIEHANFWAPRAERSRLATAASDILSIMGLGEAKPQAPVKRRVIP